MAPQGSKGAGKKKELTQEEKDEMELKKLTRAQAAANRKMKKEERARLKEESLAAAEASQKDYAAVEERIESIDAEDASVAIGASQQLQGSIERAFLGFAWLDILSKPALSFGAHVDEGLRRFDKTTFIPVMISKTLLKEQEAPKVKAKAKAKEKAKAKAQFTESEEEDEDEGAGEWARREGGGSKGSVPKRLEALGGQHRHAAVSAIRASIDKDTLKKSAQKLVELRALGEHIRDVIRKADEEELELRGAEWEKQAEETRALIEAEEENVRRVKTFGKYKGKWLIGVYAEEDLTDETRTALAANKHEVRLRETPEEALITICRTYKKMQDTHDVLKQGGELLKKEIALVKAELLPAMELAEVEVVDGVPQYEEIPEVTFLPEDCVEEEPMEVDNAERSLSELRSARAVQFLGRVKRKVERLEGKLEELRQERSLYEENEKRSKKELERAWQARMVKITSTQPPTIQKLVGHTVTLEFLLTYLAYREYYPALDVTSTRWMTKNIMQTPGELYWRAAKHMFDVQELMLRPIESRWTYKEVLSVMHEEEKATMAVAKTSAKLHMLRQGMTAEQRIALGEFTEIDQVEELTKHDHARIEGLIKDYEYTLEHKVWKNVVEMHKEEEEQLGPQIEAMAAARAKLAELLALCRSAVGVPARDALTTKMMEYVDDSYKKTIRPSYYIYAGTVGNWKYDECLRNYAKTVAAEFANEAKRFPKEDVESRNRYDTYAWRALVLLGVRTADYTPWPMATRIPLEEAYKRLSKSKEGLQEVVMWFAPLMLYSNHNTRGHGVKDLTLALFKSLTLRGSCIARSKIEEAQDKLFERLWGWPEVLDTLQRSVGPGCRYTPPQRMLKNTDITQCALANVTNSALEEDDPDTVDPEVWARSINRRPAPTGDDFINDEGVDEPEADDEEFGTTQRPRVITAAPSRAARRSQTSAQAEEEAETKSKQPKQPFDIAPYVEILKRFEQPYPLAVFWAGSVRSEINTMLNTARQARAQIVASSDTYILNLIARNPIDWQAYTSKSWGNISGQWLGYALLEEQVIRMYRPQLLASREGAYVRHVLGEALQEYLKKGVDAFPWVDGIESTWEDTTILMPSSQLAIIQRDVINYRREARKEVEDALTRVQNLAAASAGTSDGRLPTKPDGNAPISPEVGYALQVLRKALHFNVERNIWWHEHAQMEKLLDHEIDDLLEERPSHGDDFFSAEINDPGVGSVVEGPAFRMRHMKDGVPTYGELPFVELLRGYRQFVVENRKESRRQLRQRQNGKNTLCMIQKAKEREARLVQPEEPAEAEPSGTPEARSPQRATRRRQPSPAQLESEEPEPTLPVKQAKPRPRPVAQGAVRKSPSAPKTPPRRKSRSSSEKTPRHKKKRTHSESERESGDPSTTTDDGQVSNVEEQRTLKRQRASTVTSQSNPSGAQEAPAGPGSEDEYDSAADRLAMVQLAEALEKGDGRADGMDLDEPDADEIERRDLEEAKDGLCRMRVSMRKGRCPHRGHLGVGTALELLRNREDQSGLRRKQVQARPVASRLRVRLRRHGGQIRCPREHCCTSVTVRIGLPACARRSSRALYAPMLRSGSIAPRQGSASRAGSTAPVEAPLRHPGHMRDPPEPISEHADEDQDADGEQEEEEEGRDAAGQVTTDDEEDRVASSSLTSIGDEDQGSTHDDADQGMTLDDTELVGATPIAKQNTIGVPRNGALWHPLPDSVLFRYRAMAVTQTSTTGYPDSETERYRDNSHQENDDQPVSNAAAEQSTELVGPRRSPRKRGQGLRGLVENATGVPPSANMTSSTPLQARTDRDYVDKNERAKHPVFVLIHPFLTIRLLHSARVSSSLSSLSSSPPSQSSHTLPHLADSLALPPRFVQQLAQSRIKWNKYLADAFPDLGDIVEPFLTDDTYSQDDVLCGLTQEPGARENHVAALKAQRMSSIKLSQLERWYTTQAANKAMHSMHSLQQVQIDDQYMFPHDEPSLRFQANDSYLDALVLVPNTFGLDALLPRLPPDAGFALELDLLRRAKSFRYKHGRLGFAPKDSMLYLGRCRQEEIWLVWTSVLPVNVIGQPDRTTPRKVDTTLPHDLYIITLMFLALTMHEAGIQDIAVNGARYPEDLQSIDADLRKLHNTIQRRFDSWLDQAPASWKNIIEGRYPIVISAACGQNWHFHANVPDANSEFAWCGDRDFREIRFMSVAFATELAIYRCENFQPIPIDDLIELQMYANDQPIYDHWDPELREQVNLEHFPLYHEATGDEIPVYRTNGTRLHRHSFNIIHDEDPCPSLFNLRTVNEFLQGFAEEDDMDVDNNLAPTSAGVQFFPQAFLGSVGHYQAEKLPVPFYPILRKISRTIGLNNNNNNNNFDNNAPITQPVIGCSSQAYNTAFHRIRFRTSSHDAQLAQVTAFGAAPFATSTKEKEKSAKLAQRLEDYGLPFTRLKAKLADAALNTNIRLENVYHVDLAAIHDNSRTAEGLFNQLVLPLCNAWGHPSVITELTKHLVILRPAAYPNLYLWTSYPIASAMEALFRQMRSAIADIPPPGAHQDLDDDDENARAQQAVLADLSMKHCYLIEMTAMLERSANYGQTGNVRVITRTLMDYFGLSAVILRGSLPYLNNLVNFGIQDKRPVVVINLTQWPRDKFKQLLTSASASIQFHYGPKMSEYYILVFRIYHAYLHTNPVDYPNYTNNHLFRSILSIFDACVSQFIEDTVSFVHDRLKPELKRQRRSQRRPIQQLAELRNKHLKIWVACPNPLSLADVEAGTHLTVAVRADGLTDKGLPLVILDRYSYTAMAQDFLKFAKTTNNRGMSPPFTSGHQSLKLLRVAYAVVKGSLSNHNQAVRDKMVIEAIKTVLIKQHVHFIPWSPDANGVEQPSRTISPSAWRLIEADLTVTTPAATRPLLIADNSAVGCARNAITLARRTSTTAPWSAIGIKMTNFKEIIGKRSRPSDLAYAASVFPESTKNKDNNAWVKKQYDWTIANLDMSKPSHRVILYAARICIATLPDIFIDADHTFPKKTSWHEDDALQAMRNAPVLNKDDRKGHKNPDFVFTPIIAMAIGLLEPASPLGTTYAVSGNLSSSWSKKHGHKGVCADLLTRFGLCTPRRPFKGSPKGSWKMKSHNELEVLCRQFERLINTDSAYGVQRAVAALCGPQILSRIVAKGLLGAWVSMPVPVNSGQKRPRVDCNQSSDIEMDDEPQKRPRQGSPDVIDLDD
ncbi:hypothetical protein BC835DRAFT_1424143 [Cytidiella melzeri]|nr:hypothetical protein BC835DRAFT_1424143 [Cytidiella melzeri]